MDVVPMTQCSMILGMLRRAGSAGVSSLEITLATNVVNVTGRISDLRDLGHAVECFKVKGVNRYKLASPLSPVALEADRRDEELNLIPPPTAYGVW